MPKHCEHLAPYIEPCDTHGDDPWSCPDILFCYSHAKGWGIPVRDGGSSFVTITHCPFCGERLKRPGEMTKEE